MQKLLIGFIATALTIGFLPSCNKDAKKENTTKTDSTKKEVSNTPPPAIMPGDMKVGHFEFGGADPEKSKEFFSKTFGWQFMKYDGPTDYWLVMTGDTLKGGIGGGMMKKKDFQAMGGNSVSTIMVPNIDDYSKKVTDAGGKIIVPKMPVPGVGYHCYFKDIDGNTWGMFQMDPTAKMPDKPAK